MQILSYIGYLRAATSMGGVFMLAMVIWFYGRNIGADGFFPLESATNRLIAIGLLALAVIGWLVFKGIKRLRSAKNLEEGIAAPIADDGAVLADKMKDALTTLKKAGRSGDYLYSIPWYIIIGPPGAGKTTALLNSGLKFPLMGSGSVATVEGVGGTRYCDWWFSEEAVLIDTAGRYTTQDSGAEGENAPTDNVDRGSWLAFLDLLRKNRARQPINGVILAMGIDDLVTMSEAERNAHAAAIRTRLVELHEKLKVAFPVYVMFTKADLIQGFGEFFGDLREKERQIVWGATFQTDERDKNTITEVPAELDALVMRLSENTIDRLQSEPNQARRSLIIGFPAQFNALREPAVRFLSRIFEPTRYHANAILRGFYFTSGTQEGTALDQLIGATSRVLGEDSAGPQGLSGKGHSFFITNLLTKVIFGEAGWVSYNRGRVRRDRAIRLAGLTTVALATVICLGALGYSFAANRALISDVDRSVEEYRVGAAGLLNESEVASPDLADAHSRLLWPLRTLPAGYEAREANVPVYEGFGLSQRGRLTSAAEEAYYRALERSFRSRLVLRVEEVLAANLDNPEFVYDTLKVYRMLTGEKTDRDVIINWVVRDWEQNVYAGRLNAGGRAALRDHLLAMLELDLGRPVTISRNEPLVRGAEQVLARVPLVDLAFARLALDASADPALFDWMLVDQAGSDAPLVLRTRDGPPLDDVHVPSFFTRAGFQKALINRLPTIRDEIAAEAWLFGEAANQRAIREQYETLQQDLLRRYHERYIETWRGLLDNLLLTPMAVDKPRYVALRALSSPASPLRQLLQSVSEETLLTKVEEAAAGDTDVASTDGGAQLTINADLDNRTAVRETLQTEPGAAVEAAFAPFNELISAETEPSLGPVIAALSEIHDRLINLATDTAGTEADAAALNERVGSLKAEAARLPEPASRLVLSAIDDIEADLRGERVTRVSQLFNTAVTRQCEAIVSNRFPFFDSERDVTLGDFATLFKPDGLFDAFRKQNLDVYIDKSGQDWRWLPNVDLSERTLRAFQQAAAITEAFFEDGKDTPSFSVIVTTPLDPSASSGVLRINRTFVHASRVVHSQPVAWPGDNADNRAVVSVTYGPSATTERIAQQGPWALFRLVRSGRSVVQDDKLTVDFNVGGKRLAFSFASNEGANPLTLEALSTFRCPTEL